MCRHLGGAGYSFCYRRHGSVTMSAMHNARDFAVIVSVFLAAAFATFYAAYPAIDWAQGNDEWKGLLAIAWLVICCAAVSYLALRALAVYREWTEKR